MSHETPGIRWFASELIRFFWRQAIGEVTKHAGWGHRLSLSERGRVAAWLASAESQGWWHLLDDVDQTRALAQDAFVEAVEEILELDADPRHVGELEDEDRKLLTEALHYLEILRERERNGVPPPRGEAWTMVLESAAEEAGVSEPTQELDGQEMIRRGSEYFRDNPDATSAEVYEWLGGFGELGLTPTSWSAGGYATKARRRAEEMDDEPDPKASESPPPSPEREEAADEVDQTPREESPSGPEPHEGGTDSVSEEQPEAPSGEPEETGSTPGGEGETTMVVQGSAGDPAIGDSNAAARVVPEDSDSQDPKPRPTIHLEADGQRFVAHRNGDGWDLELRVRGVDREIAGDLHDVAFGLLFDRMEETSA